LGISGISNDIRPIKEASSKGDKLSKLAIDMFIYRIKKYIGAYYMILEGADAVCFTAGIGENNPELVARMKRSIAKVMPKKTKILVVPTDEGLMIASLTFDIYIRNTTRAKKG